MIKVLAAVGAIQFVQMAVLLARTKGLALLLGPELVGVLAVIDKLVAVVAQTASLSMPFAALRFLPSLWTTDPRGFYARLRGMATVLLGLTALGTAIGLTVTAVAPQLWGTELIPYTAVVFIALMTVPAQALVPFVTSATAATLAPGRSMLVGLGHAVVLAVAGLAGAMWLGLQGIYLLYLVPATILAMWALTRLATPAGGSPELPSPIAAARELPRDIWRFGGALLGLAFLLPYAALFVHYRVLADIGASAAGLMQAAMGISLSVRTVLGSAHSVFLTPNVNRGGAPAQRMQWANDYQKTLCLLIGVVLPPLLLFADVVVRLLYSAEFAAAAQFVFLFVLVEIVTLLSGTFQSLILALDRMRFHVVQNLIAQLIMISVGVLTIRPLGIAGAAAAALASSAFLYVSTAIFLRRAFNLRISWQSARLAFYVVAVVIVTGLIGRMPSSLELPALALRASVYAATVAGLAAFLTKADYQRLRALTRELSSRALPS
jgi:enterobacterial common antigen flippase